MPSDTSPEAMERYVAVLRVSGPRLDARYLDAWAGRLGVTELLDRARAEAAGD